MTSKTFCLYPFLNLNSNTEGSVKLCCSITENIHVKDANGKELNFGSHDIEEIWHSNYMKDIRQQMLDGERPSACNVCWRMEDMGLRSSRQSAWGEFKDLDIDLNEISNLDPPLPNSLELRLGNFCNLRCNSCWSLSSDRIWDERKKLLTRGDLPFWARAEFQSEVDLANASIFNWWENDIFIESIRKVAPKLKRLYLTGGEPTLIKRNTEIMKMILDSGNTDCYIALTTNLTNWDGDFFDTMRQFKHGEFQVSIDNTGDKNTYMRYPTQWQHVENNMAAIYHNFPVEWKIKHYTVFQTYNYDSIPEILEWTKNQRKWWSDPANYGASGIPNQRDRIHIWSPIILDTPTQLNIKHMPENLRILAAERLENYINENIDGHNLWYRDGARQAIGYLKNKEHVFNDYEWKKFFQYNELLDRQRGTDFYQVFPEFKNYKPEDI